MLLFYSPLISLLIGHFLVILKHIIKDIFANPLNFDLDLIIEAHKETEKVCINLLEIRRNKKGKKMNIEK